MSGRDANQLAADVRKHRLPSEIPGQVFYIGESELAWLVALVGTLQQERDEARGDLVYQTRESQGRERRRLAAEAALAERTEQRDHVGKMAADAAVGQAKAEAALATTRQALTDFAEHGTRYDCNPTVRWPMSEVHHWWVERATGMDNAVRERASRALADTGGDTKEPA